MTDTSTQDRVLHDHEISWWLRSRLSAIPRRWEAEGIRVCRHIRADIEAGSTRMPGVTALWSAGHLGCIDCSPRLGLAGDADRECDRCYAIVPPGQTIAGLIYDTNLAGRRLLILFGLCPTCLQREGIE